MFEIVESIDISLDAQVKELESINKRMAKLLVQKELLTESIIKSLGHEHEGQKSYECDVWKIEVKTPFVYSLNKKLYQDESVIIPNEFNPVKESITYTIDKKLCDKYVLEAPEEIKSLLIELIDKKPGKASIVIKTRAI